MPLRIAHINTERTWRGGEQQVFSLMKGLNQKGHFNLAVARLDFPLSDQCHKARIPVFGVRPWGEWDFMAAHRVNRMLKKEKIDLVHAHTSHGAALAAFSTLGTKIPVVVSRRVDFHLSKNPFSRWKYRRATRFISISDGVKKILLEDGIPKEKIIVVHSGIEFSRFENLTPVSRKEMEVSEKAVVIGQVAALEDHKDQDNFLKALALLKKTNPAIEAVIVGDGSLESELKATAKELQVDSFVRFLGFQKEPLRFLLGFDVFCLSSKLEGMGTSILDAMALRIPVVATNTGGIPEIVKNEDTGYLVRARDPADLAAGLAKAIQEKPQNQAILDSAAQMARSHDVIHTINQTEEVYHSLLS